MSHFRAILARCIMDQSLIDISTYHDPTNDIACFVHQVSDDLVCLIIVQDDGSYDGFEVMFQDDIYFIRKDNPKLEIIEKRVRLKNEIPDIGELEMSTMAEVAKDINSKFGYISIKFENVESEYAIVGELEHSDEVLVLREYTPADTPMRSNVVLRTKDVTVIGHGGKFEIETIAEALAPVSLSG